MEPVLHPAAPHHLAPFMSAPGHTDVLLVAMGILLMFAVIGVGVFYLKLHALPEQMAHRSQKVQFEIVAVLALLALFTHYHIFWIAALLLALIPMPDFSTPLISMADSLRLMARPAKPIVAPPSAAGEPLPGGDRPTQPPEA